MTEATVGGANVKTRALTEAIDGAPGFNWGAFAPRKAAGKRRRGKKGSGS